MEPWLRFTRGTTTKSVTAKKNNDIETIKNNDNERGQNLSKWKGEAMIDLLFDLLIKLQSGCGGLLYIMSLTRPR